MRRHRSAGLCGVATLALLLACVARPALSGPLTAVSEAELEQRLGSHLAREDFQAAVPVQGLLSESPEFVRLAQLLLLLEMPFEASEVLARGLVQGVVEETASTYELLARSLLRARRPDLALAPLERAAELSPDGNLHVAVGRLQLRAGDWDSAEHAFSTAIEKGSLDDPRLAKSLLRFARHMRARRSGGGDFWLPGEFERSLREREQRSSPREGAREIGGRGGI